MRGAWGGGGLKMLPKNTCDGVHLTGKDVSRFKGGGGWFFKWWGLIFKWGDTPWGGGGYGF